MTLDQWPRFEVKQHDIGNNAMNSKKAMAAVSGPWLVVKLFGQCFKDNYGTVKYTVSTTGFCLLRSNTVSAA
jgi:hypothetical protein